MPEINMNEIPEALNDKVDLPNGGTQSSVDFVVWFQVPTEQNNWTYCRLYKSGWTEQGGILPGEQSVTFPIEMANVNYTILLTASRNGTSVVYGTNAPLVNVSTTGFYPYFAASGNKGTWRVEGMGNPAAIQQVLGNS